MEVSSVYETCASTVDAESENHQDALLRCITASLESTNKSVSNGLDTFFLVYAATLVFVMQAGFAMLCAGSVRLKNVQNTMLKNLLDACGAALGFYSFGFAFAYGEVEEGLKTFIGSSKFFLIGVDPGGLEGYIFWLFQFAFAATSCTIVAGTLAERCQMAAYLCYSVVLTGFVYPVIVHAIWSKNGFLSAYAKDPLWGSGMVDFAGSGVVHATGGITALFATFILGPRKGRFFDSRGNRLAKPKHFPGHSVALQVLGTFILWFGWYGFNTGSALSISSENQSRVAALAAVNTTLSAASGGVASLSVNYFITERLTGEGTFNIVKCMNGCLSGLVAITCGCALIEPWAAAFTGFIGGLLYLYVSSLLVKYRLDDAVDAIPVHLVNGVWGLLSSGLFSTPDHLHSVYGRSDHVGWFYSWARGSSDATLLFCQIIGILFIFGWVLGIMFPFFCLLNYLGWFRADALAEVVGLDISYHGGSFHGRDEIKPEYMEAYHKRREAMLKQRKSYSNTIDIGNVEEPDNFEEDDGVDRITATI